MRDFEEKEIRKKKCSYRLDYRKKRGRTFSEKKNLLTMSRQKHNYHLLPVLKGFW